MPSDQPGAVGRREARLQRLLHGPIAPALARIAVPNMGVAIVQIAVTAADAWYVGQLGVAPLAALALVFPIQALMQMMSVGAMGGGISSAIARALGAGDHGRAEALMVHALIIGIVMAFIYTVLFGLLAEPLFRLLGGRGEALEGAVAYARILFGGAIVIWIANVLASILRGTGNMTVPSGVLISVFLFDVVLSGALTLGWFGLPAFGIRGPALAFVTVFGLAGVAMGGYLLAGRAGLTLRLFSQPIRWSLFADILRVGGMACGNSLLTVGTIVIVTGLVGRYGTEALAGFGLGSRLELMIVPFAFGIGGALTAMVGICRGAGEFARARRTAWTGGLIVFALTSVIGLTAAVMPDLWIGLFTTDAEAAAVARRYLQIVGPFYGFSGLGMTLYFASQGNGNVVWPFVAGLSRLFAAAGLGAVAALGFDLPVAWLFAAVALGLVVFGGTVAASLFMRVWNPPQED